MAIEQKPKIALLTLRSDVGGGPKHVFDLIRENEKAQLLEYHVVSPVDPPYGPYFQQHARSFFVLQHRSFSPLTMLRLVAHLRRQKIDLVHSHGRGAGLYAGFLSWFGISVVHSFHGIHIKSQFSERLKTWIEKIMWSRFVYFFSVSPDEREIAASKYGLVDHVTVIANGIDLDDADLGKARDQRARRPRRDIVVLGTLSRLDPHKGNDILIRHFAGLPTHYHLRIAGFGEQKVQLLALIQSLGLQGRVFILEDVRSPWNFLSEIDIYVSGSKGEGLPYSVIEAKALKIPCVLSDVSGHRALEKQFRFPLNDGQVFKDLIEKARHSVPAELDPVYSTRNMYGSVAKKIKELLQNSRG